MLECAMDEMTIRWKSCLMNIRKDFEYTSYEFQLIDLYEVETVARKLKEIFDLVRST